MRIKEIASVRKRYGHRRIHVLLLREGWKIKHKRVYRLYRQEGLNLRKPSSRKNNNLSSAPEKCGASAVNKCWCMDFVSDQLYDAKRFRALTMLDTFSRENLVIYVDKSIRGEQVCEALKKVKAACGLPARIKIDNGPEFISRALGAWAYFNKVKLDYSQPSAPTDYSHIESFNGSFWDECLNMS